MAKLWDKGYSLDALLERFTVGQDYLLDRRLVAADAVASIAHVRMLESVGLLDAGDCVALETGLRSIAREAVDRGCEIRRDQEDSHTYIEERLVASLGDAGRRIHTGRSRNDQVLASTRVFAREGVLEIRRRLAGACAALLDLARREELTPIAGRTHMQPAMPSTVGLWAASYAESLLDADLLLATAYRLLNRSPLGAAASYGVPLPIDRELVARLLGFDGIHHNVLAAVSSRGEIEKVVLDALDSIGILLSRLAQDLVLFTLPEFGYFTLPAELTTGSSIMPQKRNPDGLELMRGKSAVLSGYADQCRNIVRSLPSSYNRDVQETKEPFLRGIDLACDLLAVTELTAAALTVNRDRLLEGFTPQIFATDVAIDRVKKGESFRDAYRAVAAELPLLARDSFDVEELIGRRTATGTPGNPDLGYAAKALEELRASVAGETDRIRAAVADLVGSELSLYPGAPADR